MYPRFPSQIVASGAPSRCRTSCKDWSSGRSEWSSQSIRSESMYGNSPHRSDCLVRSQRPPAPPLLLPDPAQRLALRPCDASHLLLDTRCSPLLSSLAVRCARPVGGCSRIDASLFPPQELRASPCMCREPAGCRGPSRKNSLRCFPGGGRVEQQHTPSPCIRHRTNPRPYSKPVTGT